ncbi:MAG: Bacterial extracellular solute-binding protein [bacterium ADurb.Bin400]|nr:MAG: Bacterial extracellular solute-binding protein [bacterium ADurb.Bin400]
MPNDWVYRHQAKLQPLVPGILAEFDVNKYIPAVQQSIVINDQVYALSPSAEPLMVYYNPKLFEAATERVNKAYEGREEENKEVIEKAHRLLSEPPKTWTEFTETVKLLTTKNGGNVETAGVAMGTEKIAHSADILYLLMMQNETSIISDDMKLATFNLPRQTAVGQEDYSGKRALELYTSFANQSSPNYSWNDALGNEVDAFANGKVAMIFGYSNIQNYLLQKYPNLPFQYRKTFVPQVGQDNDSIVDYARFTAFGVPNISRNPVMAWKLLNIIANDHADVLNAANRTYTSHAAEELKVTMEERVAGDPEKLSLVKAKSLVKGRFPIEFDNQFRYAIYLVNRGSQDPKSALDLASINITKLLTRTEW